MTDVPKKKAVKKPKELELVNVPYHESTSLSFIPPTRCKYYIKNAMGDYTYVKTSNRGKAQARIDEVYGRGKYRVCEVIKAEIR